MTCGPWWGSFDVHHNDKPQPSGGAIATVTNITTRVANIDRAVAAIKTHNTQDVVVWEWYGLTLRSRFNWDNFARVLDRIDPDTGAVLDTVTVRARRWDEDPAPKFYLVLDTNDVVQDDVDTLDVVFGSALTVLLLHAYGE